MNKRTLFFYTMFFAAPSTLWGASRAERLKKLMPSITIGINRFLPKTNPFGKEQRTTTAAKIAGLGFGATQGFLATRVLGGSDGPGALAPVAIIAHAILSKNHENQALVQENALKHNLDHYAQKLDHVRSLMSPQEYPNFEEVYSQLATVQINPIEKSTGELKQHIMPSVLASKRRNTGCLLPSLIAIKSYNRQQQEKQKMWNPIQKDLEKHPGELAQKLTDSQKEKLEARITKHGIIPTAHDLLYKCQKNLDKETKPKLIKAIQESVRWQKVGRCIGAILGL